MSLHKGLCRFCLLWGLLFSFATWGLLCLSVVSSLNGEIIYKMVESVVSDFFLHVCLIVSLLSEKPGMNGTQDFLNHEGSLGANWARVDDKSNYFHSILQVLEWLFSWMVMCMYLSNLAACKNRRLWLLFFHCSALFDDYYPIPPKPQLSSHQWLTVSFSGISGGRAGAVRYSVMFSVAGTSVDFAILKLKPVWKNFSESISQKSEDWLKLPEWSPIQVLDEEALAAKKAREQKLYGQRALGSLNKEESWGYALFLINRRKFLTNRKEKEEKNYASHVFFLGVLSVEWHCFQISWFLCGQWGLCFGFFLCFVNSVILYPVEKFAAPPSPIFYIIKGPLETQKKIVRKYWLLLFFVP